MKNNIYVIEGKIYDFELLDKLKNDAEYKNIIYNNVDYKKLITYEQKKLYIYLNFQYLESLSFDEYDETLIKILKERYKILQTDNIYEDIETFYLLIVEYRLSKIIDYILNLDDLVYKKMKKLFLIPKGIIELKNNNSSITNMEKIKQMLELDADCIKYIDLKDDKKDELIEYIINNRLIERKDTLYDKNILLDYVFNNISDNLLNNKDLVIKLILITPRTYKYINHNFLTKEIIEYLLDNYIANSYYKNFCSDPRFYKYAAFYDVKNGLNKNEKQYSNNYNNGYQDIVKVISQYINLNKSGNDYIGLCPFHDDHNPSLRVSPWKGIWKCFGCGVCGNALSFVKLFNDGKEYNYYYKKKLNNLYEKNIKNDFIYYLFANLPSNLKNDIEIIKYFLEKDGCLFKLIPKNLKFNEELINIAMKNDITSIRYFINNKDAVNKYLKEYPILNYYMPKNNKLRKKNIIEKKYGKNENNIFQFEKPIQKEMPNSFLEVFVIQKYTIETTLTDDDLPF